MKVSRYEDKNFKGNQMKERTGTVKKSSTAVRSLGISRTSSGVKLSVLFPEASVVQVAGDFNNWQPDMTPMRKVNKDGVWEVSLALASGTYRYRLVADGQWLQDPTNDMTELNPYGDLNSVLQID